MNHQILIHVTFHVFENFNFFLIKMVKHDNQSVDKKN